MRTAESFVSSSLISDVFHLSRAPEKGILTFPSLSRERAARGRHLKFRLVEQTHAYTEKSNYIAVTE